MSPCDNGIGKIHCQLCWHIGKIYFQPKRRIRCQKHYSRQIRSGSTSSSDVERVEWTIKISAGSMESARHHCTGTFRKLREKAYELPERFEHKHEVVELKVYEESPSAPEEIEAMAIRKEAGDVQKQKESRIHITCGSFRVDIDDGADKSTLRDTLSILQTIC